jgi:phosphatidylserine decarboxylase
LALLTIADLAVSVRAHLSGTVMVVYRHSIVAREGWPWLIGTLLLTGLFYHFVGPLWAVPPAALTFWFFLLFRDPARSVPPLPDGVLAPVDGRILKIIPCVDELLPGGWWRIVIRPYRMGAYTVRAPIEGTILEVRDKVRVAAGTEGTRGLWLHSEEDDDVVVLFPGSSGKFGPHAFARYGERVGQGHRFAYLRLATRAEVYVADSADVAAAVGDRVVAGVTIIANLDHKQPINQ